jgi:hypothetical protein
LSRFQVTDSIAALDETVATDEINATENFAGPMLS